MPADPFLTTIRTGEGDENTGPPLPTTTVFTVPTGANGVWKVAGSVPAVRGNTFHVVRAPGCHIQPIPGINIQLP